MLAHNTPGLIESFLLNFIFMNTFKKFINFEQFSGVIQYAYAALSLFNVLLTHFCHLRSTSSICATPAFYEWLLSHEIVRNYHVKTETF